MTMRAVEKPLYRGELAKRAGCNLETIRYYEKIGLMATAPRDESGYRAYDENLVRQLRFILRARELGFTIAQIRGLLALTDGGHQTCAEVKARTEEHLADIRKKIADLRRMTRTLEHLAAKCVGGQTSDCAILDALST